ncbi:hypothetical protein ACERIT_01290 [Halopenitus sp. H-Gu1]|uniref:DUF7311 family protein n=1 Tax=Halopenitus sp. H-Gu1 TaxID=3242697 RepID=UPI00359F03DB
MIRTVLAVAIAVGLLAVAAPALADAREGATRTELDRIATHIERTGADLAFGSTAVADPDLTPRSVFRVTLPSGFARAPIEEATIGCRADVAPKDAARQDTETKGCELLLASRMAEAGVETQPIPGVTLAPKSSPIELSVDGTILRLTHRRRDGRDVVELREISPTKQNDTAEEMR